MRTGFVVCLALVFLSGALFAGDELQRIHPRGTAEMIDKLDVSEIEKIELLRLDWGRNPIDDRDTSPARRVYTEAPLLPGEEKREQAATLLKLIKDAPAFAKRQRGFEPMSSDSVMVIHLKGGQAFEIVYHAGLKSPFAGRYSLELKEALWSLSHHDSRITIIHIKDGKVKRTIHEIGSGASGTLQVEMHLTREKGLSLYLRLMAEEDYGKPLKDRKVEMEDEQVVHYGESAIYKSGEDTYAVMVEQGMHER
ncbi:MAG TPA: hypothetical protein VKX17_13470 [Planctomycetota bacterium]|nr:hypothetical protein [Planctomycetota bacterium]